MTPQARIVVAKQKPVALSVLQCHARLAQKVVVTLHQPVVPEPCREDRPCL